MNANECDDGKAVTVTVLTLFTTYVVPHVLSRQSKTGLTFNRKLSSPSDWAVASMSEWVSEWCQGFCRHQCFLIIMSESEFLQLVRGKSESCQIFLKCEIPHDKGKSTKCSIRVKTYGSMLVIILTHFQGWRCSRLEFMQMSMVCIRPIVQAGSWIWLAPC